MRHLTIRTAVLAFAAVALLASGCAKKGPAVPPAPPAPAPSTSTPQVPVPATDTTPAPVTPAPATATVSDLRTVYFELDSWSLDEAAHAALDNNAKVLRDNAGMNVRVEGHCDERGTVEYNISLGQKRADSVRDYLVGAGVAVNRLSTISYGKERPASDGHDEAAWSRNRRVEFSKP
jgi:peptidoglycan-associated lipoprotein